MSNELSLDEWELALKQKRKELEACQKREQVKSCLSCSKLLNCETHDTYVHAVYSSMNKGTGGGFEF